MFTFVQNRCSRSPEYAPLAERVKEPVAPKELANLSWSSEPAEGVRPVIIIPPAEHSAFTFKRLSNLLRKQRVEAWVFRAKTQNPTAELRHLLGHLAQEKCQKVNILAWGEAGALAQTVVNQASYLVGDLITVGSEVIPANASGFGRRFSHITLTSDPETLWHDEVITVPVASHELRLGFNDEVLGIVTGLLAASAPKARRRAHSA